MRILFRAILNSALVFVSTRLLFSQAASAANSHHARGTFSEHTSEATGRACEDAWFAHVKVLASDELKERLPGTPDSFMPLNMSKISLSLWV